MIGKYLTIVSVCGLVACGSPALPVASDAAVTSAAARIVGSQQCYSDGKIDAETAVIIAETGAQILREHAPAQERFNAEVARYTSGPRADKDACDYMTLEAARIKRQQTAQQVVPQQPQLPKQTSCRMVLGTLNCTTY